MKRKFQICVFIVLSIVFVSTAGAIEGGTTQLPACTGNGNTTSVGFLPSWGGQGSFKGILIKKVDPLVTTIQIFVSRSGQKGERLYSGSVRSGQFIPLRTHNIIWTGYRSKNGCNGSAVYVKSIY